MGRHKVTVMDEDIKGVVDAGIEDKPGCINHQEDDYFIIRQADNGILLVVVDAYSEIHSPLKPQEHYDGETWQLVERDKPGLTGGEIVVGIIGKTLKRLASKYLSLDEQVKSVNQVIGEWQSMVADIKDASTLAGASFAAILIHPDGRPAEIVQIGDVSLVIKSGDITKIYGQNWVKPHDTIMDAVNRGIIRKKFLDDYGIDNTESFLVPNEIMTKVISLNLGFRKITDECIVLQKSTLYDVLSKVFSLVGDWVPKNIKPLIGKEEIPIISFSLKGKIQKYSWGEGGFGSLLGTFRKLDHNGLTDRAMAILNGSPDFLNCQNKMFMEKIAILPGDEVLLTTDGFECDTTSLIARASEKERLMKIIREKGMEEAIKTIREAQKEEASSQYVVYPEAGALYALVTAG